MKRKLTLIFLSLVAAICLCVGLVGCDLSKKHTDHSYGAWTVIDEATCAQAGTRSRTCKECEETQTEPIAPLGHEMTHFDGTATCTQAGTSEYWFCARCEKNFADALGTKEILETATSTPLGHEFTVENKCARFDECGTIWEYTEGLEYALNEKDNTYSVTGISSASGDVVIPYGYNGQFVTSIGNQAFYDCSSLTSISIPDSVTSIGSYAFYGCSSLTTLAGLRTKSPSRGFSELSPAPGTVNLK